MNKSCPVCEFRGFRFMFQKGGYDIVKCRCCGFEFVDFEPPPRLALELYSDDFFKDGYHKYGYVDYVADAANHKRMAQSAVRFMERTVGGGRLLDVGCAAGYFLESLGPQWEAYGCEPCKGMASIAQEKFGERVAHAAFEEYGSSTRFDVITLWDTLEHVVDPAACLSKVHALMEDGGRVFLRTPDAGSPAARVLGSAWYHYGPPAHLHFFDRRTISVLLKRSGFHMVRLGYLPRYVSIAEILVNLGLMTGSRWMQSLSERLAAGSRWNRSVPYQVFDEMVVEGVRISIREPSHRTATTLPLRQ